MKFGLDIKNPEGFACLAFAGVVAGGFAFNRADNPKLPTFPAVTQIAAAETDPARLQLLEKFPLLAEKLESLAIDKNRPESSEAVVHKNAQNTREGKIVNREDTFAVNCHNLQAEWAKNLKGQFLDRPDNYPFLHLEGLWTPLHHTEDKDFSYGVNWRASSFTLSRSDKSGNQPSYSLTLACR